MPTNSKHPRPRQQARYDPQRGSNPPEMIDLVDPTWVLKALGGVIAGALLCAYITLCILFSRTQWQLILHPSRATSTTPASDGLTSTELHFGVDVTGQPQLDGWWIPAGNPASPTALLLHSGDGALSNALPAARTLHNANLNVLLFDYRGYGHSNGLHPTEASMEADADTALTYLTATRSIPLSSIVVYGTGVGGSLAVHLCAEHHDLPALILQSPDGDFESRIRQDPRSKLVPVSLLFNEPFPLTNPLQTLTTPKLLISTPNDTASLQQTLTRFLSTYLPHAPSS